MYSRIHDLREDKDLTQKQIGDLLNMSQISYNQYEIGENDIPTKVLIQLAKIFEMIYDILFINLEERSYTLCQM